MSGFLYYLPEDTGNGYARKGHYGAHDCEAARECFPQLGDIRKADADLVEAKVERGPGGNGPGMVLYATRPAAPGEFPRQLGFYPANQTWMQFADGSHRWIGWIHDEIPAPLDLSRRMQYPGYEVADESGRKWSIPIARSPHGSSSLPVNTWFGADGEPTQKVKPEYEWLWNESGILWDVFFNEKEAEEPWLIKTALRILGVNYRVGPNEVNALAAAGVPMLDSRTYRAILMASIDYPAVQEFDNKKKETSNPQAPDSSNFEIGSGDETQALHQAGAK